MPSVGIALNATGESSGGILWPVPPRPHKLFLCCKIDLTDHLHMTEAIGVDEIQYPKGHKYLTLVYQIDLGITRLLWVGKEGTIEGFQGFFTIMGEEIISKIVFVCSDMWELYLRAGCEKCSEALHILEP